MKKTLFQKVIDLEKLTNRLLERVEELEREIYTEENEIEDEENDSEDVTEEWVIVCQAKLYKTDVKSIIRKPYYYTGNDDEIENEYSLSNLWTHYIQEAIIYDNERTAGVELNWLITKKLIPKDYKKPYIMRCDIKGAANEM